MPGVSDLTDLIAPLVTPTGWLGIILGGIVAGLAARYLGRLLDSAISRWLAPISSRLQRWQGQRDWELEREARELADDSILFLVAFVKTSTYIVSTTALFLAFLALYILIENSPDLTGVALFFARFVYYTLGMALLIIGYKAQRSLVRTRRAQLRYKEKKHTRLRSDRYMGTSR